MKTRVLVGQGGEGWVFFSVSTLDLLELRELFGDSYFSSRFQLGEPDILGTGVL